MKKIMQMLLAGFLANVAWAAHASAPDRFKQLRNEVSAHFSDAQKNQNGDAEAELDQAVFRTRMQAVMPNPLKCLREKSVDSAAIQNERLAAIRFQKLSPEGIAEMDREAPSELCMRYSYYAAAARIK